MLTLEPTPRWVSTMPHPYPFPLSVNKRNFITKKRLGDRERGVRLHQQSTKLGTKSKHPRTKSTHSNTKSTDPGTKSKHPGRKSTDLETKSTQSGTKSKLPRTKSTDLGTKWKRRRTKSTDFGTKSKQRDDKKNLMESMNGSNTETGDDGGLEECLSDSEASLSLFHLDGFQI